MADLKKNYYMNVYFECKTALISKRTEYGQVCYVSMGNLVSMLVDIYLYV